jgi:hypothetical protein
MSIGERDQTPVEMTDQQALRFFDGERLIDVSGRNTRLIGENAPKKQP